MTNLSILVLVPGWMGEWYHEGAPLPEDTTADILQEYAYKLQVLTVVQRAVINLMTVGAVVDLLTEEEVYVSDEDDDDAVGD